MRQYSTAFIQRALVNPSVLDRIGQLIDEGRYSEALADLESLPTNAPSESRTDVLRAELYERVGKLAQAKTLIEAIVRSHRATSTELSACELTRGRIEWEE